MPRTTIDIDPSVLRQVKKLARTGGKTIGRVVSELLAAALAERPSPSETSFNWNAQPMRAAIDLEDEDAVYRALEQG